MPDVEVRNWFGNLVSSPRVVVEVTSVEEIVAVMKDRERYPAPVRAVGSNHSTTACAVADGGTVIVMRKMDRILEVRPDAVRVQAGALYIDVNQELRKHNLQMYVNLEIGNLTMGSAACCGTKDSSMPGEFGQTASYAQTIKMVTAAGELVEFGEDDPELLKVARSSYGLFGIVYEVTFKVRALAPLRLQHKTYTLAQFARELPALRAQGDSMMMYINPFQDSITVEFRRYQDPGQAPKMSQWQWKLRNYVWSQLAPLYGHAVSTYVPFKSLREGLIDLYNRFIPLSLVWLIRGENTLPTAQQIRYPEVSDSSRYTFSIWASPADTYIESLTRYFEFSRDYYKRTGYRVDLISVGYTISADQSSLFSYSYHGDMMTFDPVSTGTPGWEPFLLAYNDLCSELGSTPLFNQTDLITRAQVDAAFGDRLATFDRYRKRYDPDNRLLNAYFREMVAIGD